MRGRASSVAPALIGSLIPSAVLLAAAFGKALTGGVGAEIAAWSRLPLQAGGWLNILLVCVEAAIGSSLLAFPGSRSMRLCCAALLSGFSVLLGVMLFREHPPACHRLGAIRLFRSERLELGVGVLRNLLLIAGILWSLPAVRGPLAGEPSGRLAA